MRTMLGTAACAFRKNQGRFELLNRRMRTCAQRDENTKQLAQHISMLIRQRRLPEVIKYMQILHPRLEALTTLQDGEDLQVIAEFDGQMLPVQYMGDGFQNLLFALCAIVRCANGVVFFDEIDSAIHYSIVSDILETNG